MNKQNRKLSLILKIVIALTLIMIACFAVGAILIAISMPTILEQKYLKEYNVSEKRSFDGVNNLEIEVKSADINFFESDNMRIEFHGTMKGSDNLNLPKLSTVQEGDTLTIEIKYPKETFPFGVESEDLSLDIYLPNEFNGNIITETVSGDLKIKNKKLDEFEFNSVSGDLDAKDLRTESFRLTTVSGDSIIEGVTKKTAIDSISGDVTLEEEKLDDSIIINTVSGDVEMIFAEESSFSLEYNTLSGEVQNTILENIVSSANPGEKMYSATKNDGKYEVKISTVSGDLDIR